jgi:hypothetical protein
MQKMKSRPVAPNTLFSSDISLLCVVAGLGHISTLKPAVKQVTEGLFNNDRKVRKQLAENLLSYNSDAITRLARYKNHAQQL